MHFWRSWDPVPLISRCTLVWFWGPFLGVLCKKSPSRRLPIPYTGRGPPLKKQYSVLDLVWTTFGDLLDNLARSWARFSLVYIPSYLPISGGGLLDFCHFWLLPGEKPHVLHSQLPTILRQRFVTKPTLVSDRCQNDNCCFWSLPEQVLPSFCSIMEWVHFSLFGPKPGPGPKTPLSIFGPRERVRGLSKGYLNFYPPSNLDPKSENRVRGVYKEDLTKNWAWSNFTPCPPLRSLWNLVHFELVARQWKWTYFVEGTFGPFWRLFSGSYPVLEATGSLLPYFAMCFPGTLWEVLKTTPDPVWEVQNSVAHPKTIKTQKPVFSVLAIHWNRFLIWRYFSEKPQNVTFCMFSPEALAWYWQEGGVGPF